MLATVVGIGLLARDPAPPPIASAQDVDPGNCHGARQELKFAWLKPGEEPTVPTSGSGSLCLAVYHLPSDAR